MRARPHTRAERAAARRRAIRRRRTVALATLAGIAVAIALLAAPGGRAPARAHRPSAAIGRSHTSATPPGPSPGTLPQTNAYPTASSAAFKTLMSALWSGIVANRLAPALPAFFPKAAYLQLKAIGNAGGDWTGRLVHDYRLDIGAAHALLGHGAASAQLLRVSVVHSYGHWIAPGVCYNSIGYWEMPNARVVYRENGQVRSFGIASLISWRGVWYVVHLGAILRTADVGQVDDPAAGPGSSIYSATC